MRLGHVVRVGQGNDLPNSSKEQLREGRLSMLENVQILCVSTPPPPPATTTTTTCLLYTSDAADYTPCVDL
eukprot:1920469-Amphidinium_carterae.1